MESPSKPKIYVGCGLTLAPGDYRRDIVALKELLRADFDVVDFFSNPVDMQLDIQDPLYCRHLYTHDRDGVIASDCVLFEASHPSTGMGMEVGWAIAHHKPILGIAHTDANVTRLFQGITDTAFTFQRYHDLLTEAPEMARRHFIGE